MMIYKFLRYFKIYTSLKYNRLKINYINKFLISIKNPKLRIGRFLTLDLNKNGTFLTNSNIIYDNVNITILPNGVLNLRKASWIGANVTINAENVTIGKYSAVHAFGTVIGNVNIGDYVMIAKNVFISSGKHHYMENPTIPIKMQDLLYEHNHEDSTNLSVTINDDVWIGVNCIIMSGVTIGKGAIVGSNSVVTKSIEPYTVVAGSPAKPIKKRYDFIAPKSINASNYLDYPYFYAGFKIEKEPFVLVDKVNKLSALSKFSVYLKLEKENFICLNIKGLEDNIELIFQNQTKKISNDFTKIKYKIQNKDSEIFIFEINNFTYLLDSFKFEVKEVYLC